jgi:hypothetical protein
VSIRVINKSKWKDVYKEKLRTYRGIIGKNTIKLLFHARGVGE